MTSDISMATKVAASEKILASNLGDEVVMMCIDKGKYFSLKGPSGRIWNLLETPTTLNEIRGTLLAEYDVSPDECEDQLVSLIGELRDQDLVVCSN
ncbi:PqqD family peptide modification chaperone [Erythrobacter sp. THAF29]|uniref:PqqD family peptide modification chaperone n=1 Tax=Erythrobacter sp. THAF29 TaxID=2587851 RepID=UPI0012678D60|nr:PqqD family peptide modification chaperone [Erythrobacter sp. THAF29]QFT78506.1 hypothetical protein FIU90_13220 [Erythrobacter sp. THAF29]